MRTDKNLYVYLCVCVHLWYTDKKVSLLGESIFLSLSHVSFILKAVI
jgi:hypothetical protein